MFPPTYWTSLASTVGSVLLDQSASQHYIRAVSSGSNSLDGHAYNCGGLVIGFQGTNTLLCQAGGHTYQCGSYHYYGHKLVGNTLNGPFEATDLTLEDEILVSFQSQATTCHVVSLDMEKYSHDHYLGLKCPIQNIIPEKSYENNNHFSLGVSGDVAVRSPLVFQDDNDSSSSNTVLRDSYGVFRWSDNESVKFYFGPQQGRPLTILEGRLVRDSKELHIEGYEPTGPCVHDGVSSILTLDGFPQQAAAIPAATSDASTKMAYSTAISLVGVVAMSFTVLELF